MKVVLLQNVANLGKANEIKEVADGYANNFLFAKNLAVPASKKTMEDLGAKEEKQKRLIEKDLAKQQSSATKLDGYELEIREKVSKNGSLYAAVGPEQIAKLLEKHGFSISKKQVETKPLKELGQYMVKIKFDHGLESEIHLTILAA